MSDGPVNNVWIRDLIWRMFRDSADVDYAIARFSALHQLEYQYFWSASQAVEKYLKCLLLHNGKSIRNLSKNHDLLPLFDAAMEFCGDLIPHILCPPRYFPKGTGFDRPRFFPTRDFVKRISDNGDPSSRYRHISVVFFSSEVHHFDELCFRIRRLCIPLEMNYKEGLTYRDFLSHRPNDQLNIIKIPGPKKGPEAENLARYCKLMNFSFFEDEALANGKYLSGLRAVNSAIHLLYERKGPEKRTVVNWLLSNVKLSTTEKQALFESLAE